MSGIHRVWKKFIITAKHLIQRLMIRLRKLRKWEVPKEIDIAIQAIYQDCCRLWLISTNDTQLWDTGVQQIIEKNKAHYTKLFETTPDDYSPESFSPVNTKEVNMDLIAANKQLEIAEKRELIGERARGRLSSETGVFYDPRYIGFCKRLFTLELQILTKYFSFGKMKHKNEIMEIGEPIEARLLA